MPDYMFKHIVYMIETSHYFLKHFHSFFPFFSFHSNIFLIYNYKVAQGETDKKGRFHRTFLNYFYNQLTVKYLYYHYFQSGYSSFYLRMPYI